MDQNPNDLHVGLDYWKCKHLFTHPGPTMKKKGKILSWPAKMIDPASYGMPTVATMMTVAKIRQDKKEDMYTVYRADLPMVEFRRNGTARVVADLNDQVSRAFTASVIGQYQGKTLQQGYTVYPTEKQNRVFTGYNGMPDTFTGGSAVRKNNYKSEFFDLVTEHYIKEYYDAWYRAGFRNFMEAWNVQAKFSAAGTEIPMMDTCIRDSRRGVFRDSGFEYKIQMIDDYGVWISSADRHAPINAATYQALAFLTGKAWFLTGHPSDPGLHRDVPRFAGLDDEGTICAWRLILENEVRTKQARDAFHHTPYPFTENHVPGFTVNDAVKDPMPHAYRAARNSVLLLWLKMFQGSMPVAIAEAYDCRKISASKIRIGAWLDNDFAVQGESLFCRVVSNESRSGTPLYLSTEEWFNATAYYPRCLMFEACRWMKSRYGWDDQYLGDSLAIWLDGKPSDVPMAVLRTFLQDMKPYFLTVMPQLPYTISNNSRFGDYPWKQIMPMAYHKYMTTHSKNPPVSYQDRVKGSNGTITGVKDGSFRKNVIKVAGGESNTAAEESDIEYIQ